MSNHPFAVSLNPDIQVKSTEGHYTFHSAQSDPTALLTLATTPGISIAIESLKAGNTTTESLVQGLARLYGQAAGEQFAVMLQKLDERGWLSYAVLPLAVAIPMVDSAELNLTEPYWTQTRLTLSRFAYQHSYDGTMVLESPLSKFRIKLLDWRASALLAQLAQPQTLESLTPPPYLGPETAYQFLKLLFAAGFLTAESEPPALQLWDFHNLVFHSRSRSGHHDYPLIDNIIDRWLDFPVVKPPMSDQIVPLPQPNLGALMYNDATLTEAIESRKSVREYDDNYPIAIEQLSELLYRTARVKELLEAEEWFGDFWRKNPDHKLDFDYGKLSKRPYPSSGAMYELEIYLVVQHCRGLNLGVYHYDPLNHQLEQLMESKDNIINLLGYSWMGEVLSPRPQIILVITARFGRIFRRYRAMAYAAVLKNVGILYQNFYLVATNMGLAPCAIGSGNSDTFGRLIGLDYLEESVVGEFALGSLPKRNVEASGVESIGVNNAEGLTEAIVSTSETNETKPASGEAEILGNQISPVRLVAGIQPTEVWESPENTSVQVEDIGAEPVDLAPSDAMSTTGYAYTQALDSLSVAEGERESAAVLASEVESSASPISAALHPHELDDRIPGLAQLHNQTLGDPRITIVIIDGDPDHTLSCFAGAEVSKVIPYWHEPAEPISPQDYATYQAIRDQGLKGKKKEDAFYAALPKNKERVEINDHACHVTSIIVGQEHSPVFGVAPKCRVINMPHDALGNYDDMLSPLNLARAFDLALELGANIIHCAFCRPTQTGEGEEILVQAIKKCQDNNILIVAPAGNNVGEYSCLPAMLPGTLAVGAAKVDGTPAEFSNWGGNNTKEGILAPGVDILGAQPCTEKPVRQTGTSMAAPIITGISALLMSLQLQQGKPVDAEAIRAALFNTAIPCDPKVVEEPQQCLRGSVNIPGAMRVLFGQPSVTFSFTGDGMTRTERPGYAIPSAMAAPASITAASPAVEPTDATTSETSVTAADAADAATVEASIAYDGNVYALGILGYDFGDETRRDSFKELMPPTQVNGIMVPPDPYDVRQMVDYLDRNPDESRSLIWTLSLDGDTIYALDPTGPFSGQIYEIFLLMLAGQLEPETSDEFVERISVPARRTKRTVELFSGEVVPVVTVHDLRGLYGWKVNALVDAAMAAISRRVDEAQAPLVRQALITFLNRVYNDLRNVGQTSRDRALNFAATNIFQAALTFAKAIAERRQFDTITVEKSPFCRINSDCWDVKLEFYDPENSRRGRKVFRFTLDVRLLMPVTLGEIKSWSLPSNSID
ncbi:MULTISPECIES: PatA/PatG family cyanobactin maturation protease [Nostoc]|uniref:PatA/PatG family cyanobactin maturation protease n=1 Tax=Nostoc paludosum FACHB-159 TaxID=2692908 RepID=A0ABR8K4I8_9NOSO|nr:MULTISPECIES: PatA/PatG family cyanobactin maturation protease [Nostoc]MBD2677099.1 PatA/PatG family cyanobactin maturation protease [Nostoc sp. FACHB-857]MBD2733298.1 PatA/PatG family cyanobactin maturation protease [Nostoc paludosum FACHB-159]